MYIYCGLLAVLFIVAVLDLFTNRIPNYISFPLMIVGAIYTVAVHSVSGLFSIFVNLILTIVIFGYGYVKKQFGGGDIKLIFSVGCFLDCRLFGGFLLITVLSGAAFAFLTQIKHLYKVYKENNLNIKYMTMDQIIVLIKSSPEKGIAYGVFIFIGFLFIFLKEIIPNL